MNRLSRAKSAYLKQHEDNPIHWFEWGEEAFAEAASRDVPIFLSVGYSSCHWCHVMAHESFEDPEIAEILNAEYVSIKLDREERPDIDELYMTAVQIATGHGGWPMTVFLTPDRKPFFAGTYFPKESRGEYPNFRTVITGLAHSWKNHRDDVVQRADEFAAALKEMRSKSPAEVAGLIHVSTLDASIRAFHSEFDYEKGGYGGAPKFPPHATIRYLLLYAMYRPELGDVDADIEALIADAAHMALFTLERMAMGGIHDHVGGGFHRYATDGEWFLPHFEKMASDNGPMLYNYALASELAEEDRLRELFAYARDGIVRWISDEMTHATGVFYSAIDADSEGEEGAFYVWSEAELREVLGSDFEEFSKQFGILTEGNYLEESTREKTGLNVLSLKTGEGAIPVDLLAKLRERRSGRIAPLTDTKAVCSTNGLVVSGLVRAGQFELARKCLKTWAEQGTLPHVLYEGESAGEAFLDDFANMADAAGDYSRVAEDSEFEAAHATWIDDMLVRYGMESGGLAFSNAGDLEGFGLSRPAFDGATPSPNGVAIRAMIQAGRLEDARRHFLANSGWVERMVTACPTLLECLLRLLLLGEGTETAQTSGDVPKVKIELPQRELPIGADGFAETVLVVRIPNGYHINGVEPPAQWLIPTSLQVEGVYGEASFPDESEYRGEIEIPVRLRPRGEHMEFAMALTYQMCSDDACFAPETVSVEGVLVRSAGD